MSEKRYLTEEEAISILPDGEDIHTMIQSGMVFIGADWRREDIIDKIRNSTLRELTGPAARGMGHGLVLWPPNARFHSDLLFVETDKDKLDAIDPPEAEDDE